MSIVEIINHYQKSIDKSLNDEARLVHCIGKLYRLPISVQHLQETGIGRTVNGLRKYDGEVGIAAKALVTKWKTMVAAEESEDGGDQDESHRTHDDSGHGDADEDEDNYDESRLQVDEPHSDDHEQHEEESDDQADQINGHESDHLDGRNVNAGANLDSASIECHRSDRSEESSSSSRRVNGEHSHRSSSSTKDGKSRDRHEKDRSENREGKSHHSSSSSISHSSSSSRKSSKHNDKEKKDKHSSKSSSSSSSSSRKESSQSNNKKESSHSSSKERSSSSGKHHSSSKVPNEGSNGYRQEGDIHKRRRSSEGEEDSQTKKVKNEKSSEKSRSSSTSKEKPSSSKASSSVSKGKSSSSKDKEKKSSDKKRDSSAKKKDEESENSDEEVEGLDNSGGSSFADALSGIGIPSSSKKCKGSADKIKKSFTSMPPPAPKVKSERSSYSSSKSSSSKDCYSPSSTTSSSGYSSCSSTPSLLAQKAKLEPLPEAAEIVESLPLISPHYKPMPLNQTVMECVFQIQGKVHKRAMTEEEALGQSMQSKNLRTKVYSGVKNSKIGIPSLYDMCIRLLQENIDLIDYTGGIPFDLLKPVLERASAEQLFTLEDYNPYLMEDSDVLWEQHCKRMFRSQKRKEEYCESWREMFIRCSEERDAKLRSLTQNIKLSQVEKSAPVRKTQLAYIDSAVKPPRNVISKQVKYGTDRAPVVSPAARVASLKNASTNVTKAGDSRLKVAPGARDNAQVQVFHPVKPKKAPLMAKTMASIKGFKTGFRR